MKCVKVAIPLPIQPAPREAVPVKAGRKGAVVPKSHGPEAMVVEPWSGVHDAFSYQWADTDSLSLPLGSRVLVPFKNREILGYLVGLAEETSVSSLKEIKELIDEHPLLDRCFLELAHWISRYYFCSWGEAIENALPKALRLGKRFEKILPSDFMKKEESQEKPPATLVLNQEQEEALSCIVACCQKGSYQAILLHGITGSGKTEVYIRAIKTVLAMGKEAICLVPEIALTDQIKEFFWGHFPGILEIIHSRLTDRERLLAWLRIKAGVSRVILGPRSALFAPVKKLGLVIIDEEHDNSYKQNETPRYHAREVAKKRAELESAVLILGGATPSLETMREFEEGRMIKRVLSKRVVERDLPTVRVVDLRRELENHKKLSVFSYPLQREITQSLARKESVLLLLNRRGFATQVQCLACGHIAQCQRCRVSLTYHQSRKILLCHYCNFQSALMDHCPDCGVPGLKYVGWGTEKIESEIARFFPQARVARLDTDVARRKGMSEKVIQDFRSGKADILVGTQMIAKGFDFPQVTTVGVISADVGLALPDFRSSERTFQLLTQVAGRAGRGNLRGQVIIQTFSPQHHSVHFAKHHDYQAFYEKEIEKRRELGLPPFSHLVNIILHGAKEQEVYRFSSELKKALADRKEKSYELIGPAPLPFYRLRGHFRWHLMLKGDDVLAMNDELRDVLAHLKKPSRIKLIVDVDPISVL